MNFNKQTLFLISINFLIIICSVNLTAQIKVNLSLDESTRSIIGHTLFCDKDYNCGLFPNEESKISSFSDEKIQIKVLRTGKDFYFLIDTNRNNKLIDEKKILLKHGSGVKVGIQKNIESGKSLKLQYEIAHQLFEKNGLIIDHFKIIPHYVAAGALSYKNCSSKIAFSDMNFDGSFSLSDSERGTNLHLDRNNDGKFWGKEEHNSTSEIIEFCGQNFLVSVLNDRFLTLTPTDLQLARIGEKAPDFSFVLLNGENINSDKLRGKNYVLDFWASWCAPCVENLSQINFLKNDFKEGLSVFSVNVDEADRKFSVEKIINEYRLFEFSAIRGLGNDDALWKAFSGANPNRLSIPLYVLVDKEGIVRYADNGGKELADLRKNIEKLYSNE